MASEERQKQQADPYRAGYDQPGDPPNYATSFGYAAPPPQSQAYAYPMTNTQSTTNIVVSQPQSAAVLVQRTPLYNWTIPAILSCLFCFWPTGICAIVAAIDARHSYASGDYEAEKTRTAWAKGLTITSLSIGVGTLVITSILYFATITRQESYVSGY